MKGLPNNMKLHVPKGIRNTETLVAGEKLNKRKVKVVFESRHRVNKWKERCDENTEDVRCIDQLLAQMLLSIFSQSRVNIVI